MRVREHMDSARSRFPKSRRSFHLDSPRRETEGFAASLQTPRESPLGLAPSSLVPVSGKPNSHSRCINPRLEWDTPYIGGNKKRRWHDPLGSVTSGGSLDEVTFQLANELSVGLFLG